MSLLEFHCAARRATSERKSRPQGVQLGRCLVGVHAVTQRQLGNATAELSPEVVRYGLVVLSRVREGLGTTTEFTFVRGDENTCFY